MSDNNRNNNQDYLDLLGEYAQREKEEKEKEKIDENFYNREEELSSIKSEKRILSSLSADSVLST